MQLSREVSLGDTIYTEKGLVRLYFLKTLKRHDQRQILVKSLCLRIEEETEKAPKEGKIRKIKTNK